MSFSHQPTHCSLLHAPIHDAFLFAMARSQRREYWKIDGWSSITEYGSILWRWRVFSLATTSSRFDPERTEPGSASSCRGFECDDGLTRGERLFYAVSSKQTRLFRRTSFSGLLRLLHAQNKMEDEKFNLLIDTGREKKHRARRWEDHMSFWREHIFQYPIEGPISEACVR